MLRLMARPTEEWENNDFEKRPIEISEFELWQRLSDLDYAPERKKLCTVWSVTLQPNYLGFGGANWIAVVDGDDPRLERCDCFDDRVVGAGERLKDALSQAESWYEAWLLNSHIVKEKQNDADTDEARNQR